MSKKRRRKKQEPAASTHMTSATSIHHTGPYSSKIVKLQEIVARYRVLTPLFCGGAKPSEAAELRLPSFKGVLRFWWRALAWSHYGGNLTRIKDAEDDLFGSVRQRSKVVMRLGEASGDMKLNASAPLTDRGRVVGSGARYLGYGVVDAVAGKLSRACLVPATTNTPFEFEVKLRCRRMSAESLDLLQRALEAVGTIGGLGARSRHGWGSLMLVSLTGKQDVPPTSLEILRNRIAGLGANIPKELGIPQYTAFSTDTRHVLREADPADRTTLALLDRLGRELIRYRSYGQRRDGQHKILIGDPGGTVVAEQNFANDHDLMQKAAMGNDVPNRHPQRAVFGLPHNYYFSQSKGKSGVKPLGKLDRRASPMFIHIHMCGDKPVVVVSLFPARFLPTDQIRVGNRNVSLAQEPLLYQPIRAFLDRVETRPQESFGAVEVIK